MAVVIAATDFAFVLVEMEHVKEIAHSRHIRRHVGIPGIRCGVGDNAQKTPYLSPTLVFLAGADKQRKKKLKEACCRLVKARLRMSENQDGL
jgi:hypothetical protein